MNVRTLTLLALGAATGFTPAGAADDTVSIDVVVTDRRSRPVANLRPADFEIVDSGEAQSIEDVRFHSSGKRAFGIFLDEYHVQAGESSSRARESLAAFVRSEVRDTDVVFVMKPLDPLHAITPVGREAILQAISTFEGRKGDYAARTPFEANFVSRNPETAARTRNQIVAAALQALSMRLGEIGAGRKALVVISEGFEPPMPRTIVHAANRNGVAIHPIDPSPETGSDEATLRFLSEQTGGQASLNQAELGSAFLQAVTDLDGYYLVTYRPPVRGDGKFHAVEVRVKRTGALTRSRSGYWAFAPALGAMKSDARTAPVTLPFRPSHSSPYIRPWIGMARGKNGLTSVTVTWAPGKPPPRNQRVVSVHVKALASDGRVLFDNRVRASDGARATFDAPPGFIALEMALQSSTGASLDTDYRGLSVPNLIVSRPTFATPQLLRTRTARDFAEVSLDPNATPVAAAEFSRSERLLVRIPVYGPGELPPVVTATLLNRRGTPMRALEQVAAELPAGVVQFDLLLSSLAPGEYRVELVASNAEGPKDEAKQVLVFRVVD